MGWVTVGVFTMGVLGLQGALLHTMACGLATASILLLEHTQGPRGERQGVRWGQHFAYATGILSAIGVPGLAGFVSNSTLILGFLQVQWPDPASKLGRDIWSITIAVGLVLATWGLLRAWRRSHIIGDIQHALIVVPLLILIVLAGVYPTLITDIVGPSIHRLLTQILLSSNVPTDETDPSPPQPDGQEQFFPLPDRPDGTWIPRDRQLPLHAKAATGAVSFAPPALGHDWMPRT
jgi:NADH-quinone oxidoreductase subunit M